MRAMERLCKALRALYQKLGGSGPATIVETRIYHRANTVVLDCVSFLFYLKSGSTFKNSCLK